MSDEEEEKEEIAMPEYAIALFFFILKEIKRVYWNNNQQEFEWYTFKDLGVPGLQLRAHTDADVPEAELPNLAFGGVEIRWYKNPGRAMTTNVTRPPEAWIAWFDEVLAAIRAQDSSIKKLSEEKDG